MNKSVLGLVGSALLALILQAAPAAGQGIYFGPGGVGVDIGPQQRPQYRERYDDDRQPVYRERREYREPRCRDYYVQNGPYRERVRECR